MDAKTLKDVRDIVKGSGVEIPAESSAFLEGTTVEMMKLDWMNGIGLITLRLSGWTTDIYMPLFSS